MAQVTFNRNQWVIVNVQVQDDYGSSAPYQIDSVKWETSENATFVVEDFGDDPLQKKITALGAGIGKVFFSVKNANGTELKAEGDVTITTTLAIKVEMFFSDPIAV